MSANPAEPWLQVYGSRQFTSWLHEQKISLAVSAYETGKLFLIGLGPDGQLAVFERTFGRAMGLWADSENLWLSTLYQIWRLANILAPGNLHEGHDRLYIPRVGYTTGDLDNHDIAVDRNGRVVFVATRFSCLATLSERASFAPLWQPPFISRIAAEDRCHLNGLALEAGVPRYVTAVSTADVSDGWREHRRDGGVVVDVKNNQVVARGLSMPHSPRLHEGKLLVLNSGTGFLGSINVSSGAFEPIAFCPGYLRGLALWNNHAIVGMSCPRRDKTFGGLALEQNLADRNSEPRCALHVIDLASGDVEHWLRFEGMVTELYDVAVLPGVVLPMMLGFKTDEIQRFISVGPLGQLNA